MEDGSLKDDNVIISTVTPEMFARVRGEISDSKGDVSLFRASGEEVPAIKGTKLYLNDTIISGEDRAVLVKFDDSGFSVLGHI
jgi:hypothetical protein